MATVSYRKTGIIPYRRVPPRLLKFPMIPSQSRILIADDHRMFNDTVAAMLRPSFNSVWQVFNGAELSHAIQTHTPDLLLLDINLPNLKGLNAARSFRQQLPALKIILVTMYNHAHFVAEAKAIGLEGYLLKYSPSKLLIEGIDSVLNGNPYYDPNLQKLPPSTDEFVKGFLLSRREKEVIKGLVAGMSAGQIADELCISYETVKSHRKNIYLKLEVNRITDLVRLFHMNGLFD